MKYLILSDLHLRHKFEKNKMAYLMGLISQYDNVILNGDFYEARFVPAQDFLHSQYKPLIDLLKSKNTIYLYGNHDPKKYAKEVAEYISKDTALYHKIDFGTHKYHVEHGDKLAHKSMPEIPYYIHYLIDEVSYWVERVWPWIARKEGEKWNQTVLKRRYESGLITNEEILVCGHTHADVFDLAIKYVDSGYIKYGKGNYIEIAPEGIKMIPFTYPRD